jgi:hypothetical protein
MMAQIFAIMLVAEQQLALEDATRNMLTSISSNIASVYITFAFELEPWKTWTKQPY